MNIPTHNGLGKLSAWYESMNLGTNAVGWDAGGGLSLGKFQIAFKVGTLRKFLNWCHDRSYHMICDVLNPLYDTIEHNPSSKHGQFAKKWVELANNDANSNLSKAEYDFIKETHYDVAFNSLPQAIQAIVIQYDTMQDVLWSTSVQHGPADIPKGAPGIFKAAWGGGKKAWEFIRTIYVERGNHWPPGRSGRYADEAKKAHYMIVQECLNKNGASLDVDGNLGQKSMTAISNYCSTHNISATGVSMELLKSLGLV